jgi:hypothetical protein
VWNEPPIVAPTLHASAGKAPHAGSLIRSVAMDESRQSVPYYLVLRAGHECYVLDVHRCLIRRQASQLLKVFARRHGIARPLDGAIWDAFSSMHMFSAEERSTRCMFSLVAGTETPRQLELLSAL